MKRILGIGIYKPGDLTDEITSLDNVDAQINGNKAIFTGHATVKSRLKCHDFSGYYQLSKVYLKQRERWQIIASKTARLGDK